MAGIKLPKVLEQEFASVQVLTESRARTRRVDALLLAWIKYEKQLNRLLYFLIFTHPAVNKSSLNSLVKALSKVRYTRDQCIVGIEALAGKNFKSLIIRGERDNFSKEGQIAKLRNKFTHGSYSGGIGARLGFTSSEVMANLKVLIKLIDGLAQGANEVLGYDGISEGAYSAAKKNRRNLTIHYPFSDVETCNEWIARLGSLKK